MNTTRRITAWLLREHGIATDYPILAAPGDSWKNTYQVYNLSMGKIGGSLNRRIGFVSIERKPSDDGFVIEAVRKTLMESGNAFQGDATIVVRAECRNDEFATPARWSMSSVYSHFNEDRTRLEERADTRFSEEGELGDGVLRRRATPGDGEWQEIQHEGALSSNWSIFEVIQRCERPTLDSFSLLENGSRVKPGYALRPVPGSRALFDDAIGELDSVLLWGRGNLPYEFWRDRHGRVVAVVNSSKIFVLDEDAEATIARHEATGVVYPVRNKNEE